MSRQLPSGTVTFLFTDVEGSTKLLHELGAEKYADALAAHRRAIRDAFAAHGGVEVDAQGDAFFYAFPTAPEALAAAADANAALAAGPIRVRMGLHTGAPHLTDEGYVGADVHRAARIAAAGHGGQVLVSAATKNLASDNLSLTDLGEHRLKDLSAPERIFQLGHAEFPPLKSLYRTNLPVPATPFLGREGELGEVLTLLDGTRILTLTGPGGTGKTRLALHAAGAAADAYPDGVFWVPLAPLREPELVLETAASSLGAEDGLATHIADKALLLLFDNFEHVLEAADGVADLLAECPNLRVLVTSREPLHVSGEQEYAVPPLIPQEGVGFFLARARSVDPAFEADDAVAEICRRLDDLPLALELAAARVKALSSAQVLERLEQRLPLLTGGARDLPERQRTLRATIEWSHDLLDEDEQRLFSRLSVFTGGCTLEAAERICGSELDTVQSLVDKSLLRHSGERYSMLGTIREFAAEQLGDDNGLRRRHAEHFLSLAEEAAPQLGPAAQDPTPWLDRLEEDHDNIRAALDFLHEAGEGELEQRLAAALRPFWLTRGYTAEAARRLQQALAASETPTEARAWVAFGAALFASNQGDWDAAERLFSAALDIFERLGEAFGAARVRQNLGAIAMNAADFERGRVLFEDSMRTFTELGEEQFAVVCMRFLAWSLYELGDSRRAQELNREVVTRARAAGNRHMEANALGALGENAVADGRLGEGIPLLEESMRIFREIGDALYTAASFCRFARALAVAEKPAAAAEVLGRGLALYEEIDYAMPSWHVKFNDETRELIRARLDDDAYAAATERGRALTVDAAAALALDSLG
jgi:predicted ATPase/class 3 adenylate cyclase